MRVSLAITGMGAVGSVGSTVEGVCAASRAGIVRTSPLVDFDGAGEEPPMGAVLEGLTPGFASFGRWVRIGDLCLTDLLRSERIPDASDEAFWSRTGLTAALPMLDDARFGWPRDDIPSLIDEAFLSPVLELSALPIPQRSRRCVELGHCAVAAALLDAQEWIESREVDRVLITAVDSHVDPQSLGWLNEQSRLKSDANPTGMIPGEAGVCLLVERSGDATARGAESLAVVSAIELEHQKIYDEIDPVAIGTELARVVQDAIADCKQPYTGDLCLDLNGEVWRAECWGNAVTRLQPALDFDRCRETILVLSLGDVGAASGGIGVAHVARSFARGYAVGGGGLVCSVNTYGDVSAILVGPTG